MKLSVIVTVYNREKYLARCLDSILCQDLDEYEIIVIDDGSSDGSWPMIEDYRERYPEKIQAFHQANAGVSRARNAGLSRAQGEYIAFVDSDDWLKENCFGTIYREAKAHECDMIVFDEQARNPDGGSLSVKRAFYPCLYSLAEGELSPADCVLVRPDPLNKWIHRSVYGQMGAGCFPEGQIYEDLTVYPQAGLYVSKAWYLKRTYYDYEQESESIMRMSVFQEKTLDIFPAVYELKEALEERFPKEIEYIWWRHLLLLGSKRFLNFNRKDLADRASDEMRRNYPDWKQNLYVQKESRSDLLLADLLYQKKYARIRLLAGIRQLIRK